MHFLLDIWMFTFCSTRHILFTFCSFAVFCSRFVLLVTTLKINNIYTVTTLIAGYIYIYIYLVTTLIAGYIYIFGHYSDPGPDI